MKIRNELKFKPSKIFELFIYPVNGKVSQHVSLFQRTISSINTAGVWTWIILCVLLCVIQLTLKI